MHDSRSTPPPPDKENPNAPADLSINNLNRTKKFLFAAVVVVGVLLAGEAFCRLMGFGARQNVARYISEWHDTPDGRTYWVIRSPGYNSDGFRDREHAVEKPEGTQRIMCIGDSVTLGHGVKMSETYSAYLQSIFEQLKLPVEVFNVAVSGWSTLQEVAAYRQIARKYSPDHIILGFCFNDVAEMQNNLQTSPTALVSFVAQHSALIRALVRSEGRQVHNVEELMAEKESAAVQSGWELVFNEMLTLRNDLWNDGVHFSVIMFPFRFQVTPESSARTDSDSIETMPRGQRRLFEFCMKNDIPCLDLLPTLSKIGPEAFLDESHLSPKGNWAVAERMIHWARSGCVWCSRELEGFEGTNCPRCGRAIER